MSGSVAGTHITYIQLSSSLGRAAIGGYRQAANQGIQCVSGGISHPSLRLLLLRLFVSISCCGLGDVVEQCAVPDQAPVVVLRLTEALERLGWENETIYRTPPVSTGPPELRQALDTDPAAVDCEQYDLSVLADALRFYLQELSCPLIPAVVYSELVYTAQETQSLEECGQQLKRILDSPSIPQSNHQLLVYLTRHLSKVTQSGGAAQASPRLLAQVYSEAVFKNNHFSADVNPEHHVKILEALIVVGGLMEMQAAPGRPALHWASYSPPG
ncbi:hypothetical protein SRHO_G00296900 [Serrasalmus rhombeus]